MCRLLDRCLCSMTSDDSSEASAWNTRRENSSLTMRVQIYQRSERSTSVRVQLPERATTFHVIFPLRLTRSLKNGLFLKTESGCNDARAVLGVCGRG